MTYIETLLSLSYEQCVESLLNKYGSVAKDYFSDERCTIKTKGITRTKEGLIIHHIDEDKAIMLSTPEWAQKNPFAYQKANRLVYCNLLEHLVLHIKVIEYPNPEQNVDETCGVGGVYHYIVPELNDIYSGIVYRQEWRRNVVEVVLPLKNDYFKCIQKLVSFNLPYRLLTSFTHNKRIGWDKSKNKSLFREMIALGVKY